MAATQAKGKKAPSAGEVARAYFKAIADRDVDGMMTFWEPGGYGYIYGMAKLRDPDG